MGPGLYFFVVAVVNVESYSFHSTELALVKFGLKHLYQSAQCRPFQIRAVDAIVLEGVGEEIRTTILKVTFSASTCPKEIVVSNILYLILVRTCTLSQPC